ncbi:MAG: hypothetical protein V8S33_02995 [Intestinibacter bartlettii]
MFDKIKNIFKSDKEENNVTPKNAPKEVTVPAHKIGQNHKMIQQLM